MLVITFTAAFVLCPLECPDLVIGIMGTGWNWFLMIRGDFVVKNDDLKLSKKFDDITFVRGEHKPQGHQRQLPIVVLSRKPSVLLFDWHHQICRWLTCWNLNNFSNSLLFIQWHYEDIEDQQKPTTQRLLGFFAYLKDQLERLDVILDSLDVK